MHSKRPVVVVDEFDTIPDVRDRNRFAALLKALGDREVDLKFIFTGVGRSLEDLLGAHPSAYRQLATFEVSRLGWDARREIVTQAAQEFGLDVNDDVNWRIAIVSDGFPHYVHLITEHMIWQAFDDDTDCDKLEAQHYQLGLRHAIEQMDARLKGPYEKAVLHRAPEWEDLVWATADGEDLFRQSTDIEQSYKSITERRGSPVVFENSKFAESLRRLKAETMGPCSRRCHSDKAGTRTAKRCSGALYGCRRRHRVSNSTARHRCNDSECMCPRTCEADTTKRVYPEMSACGTTGRSKTHGQ
jgi:hypothetical protein